jgi:hypothetical protein
VLRFSFDLNCAGRVLVEAGVLARWAGVLECELLLLMWVGVVDEVATQLTVVVPLRSLTVTGASSGGGVSVMCFSFQCLFKLLRHLYVLPQMEQANLVIPSSMTLRYLKKRNSQVVFLLVLFF